MSSLKPHIRLTSPAMRQIPGYRWFCWAASRVAGGFGDTPAKAYKDWKRNNG